MYKLKDGDKLADEISDIIDSLGKESKLMHGDQFSVLQIAEALNSRRGLGNGSPYAFKHASVGHTLKVLGFKKSGRFRNISYYFADRAGPAE